MNSEINFENSHQYRVDWRYWADMPGWYLKEAAALLLSIEPDTIVGKRSAELNQTEFRDFIRLRRLILRARKMGFLESPCRPRDLLEWAQSNDITIPQPLADAVQRGKSIRNWKKIAQKYKKLYSKLQSQSMKFEDYNTKSINTLYKMLIAMAVDKYGYSANGNNPAPKRIETAVLGADFDGPLAQTIRVRLAEAYSVVRNDSF
ncbi:hypothetical protein [Methylobacterium oryzisoli]|uniref:hypothetical protein n=1 Tax=Methylobacterium oryzisoli TaxID=3385502 RepID=UPI003891BC63